MYKKNNAKKPNFFQKLKPQKMMREQNNAIDLKYKMQYIY